jgi:hypothetical protein
LGPRNIGYLDAEIDELIDAIAELRDAVTRHHGAALSSSRRRRR